MNQECTTDENLYTNYSAIRCPDNHIKGFVFVLLMIYVVTTNLVRVVFIMATGSYYLFIYLFCNTSTYFYCTSTVHYAITRTVQYSSTRTIAFIQLNNRSIQ